MNYTVRIKNDVEERSSDKEELKIKDVLEELDMSSETIVPKKNGEIVIDEAVVEDGDEIEFVQIIYGG